MKNTDRYEYEETIKRLRLQVKQQKYEIEYLQSRISVFVNRTREIFESMGIPLKDTFLLYRGMHGSD